MFVLSRIFFIVCSIFMVTSPASAVNVSGLLSSQAINWNGQVINVEPLKKFYKSRRGKGVWTSKTGLNKNGNSLLKILKQAGADGLVPKDYLSSFPSSQSSLKDENLALAELYLSQAFYSFSRDLFAGRTTPAVSEPDIVISRKKISLEELLKSASRKGPQKLVDQLTPKHQQYARLKKLLARTKSDAKRRQIIVNMERWRWLPSNLGKNYVLVNQAAFSVDIYNNNKKIDSRRVIVGKPYFKTPMFSHKIQYADFNPTWTVPRSIAGNEILPKLRKDPSYLAKRGYLLHTSWKADAPVMNAHSIDWQSVSSRNFPYRIVQPPGDSNALGQVKFLFPNRFNVYLHDTPSRSLFKKKARALSHGCIRVHEPLEFAATLYSLNSSLRRNKIDAIVASKKTTRVKLNKPVPVHLTYFTVWVSDNGKATFHKDIYKRDILVGKILFGKA
ncbi:MAG: L,D-transpeptidase family protein [Hyphomicrobiales bacterium]|nr:L,D-transpeptidase family protein [Hyphomicrobiales bacterium]